MTKPGTKSRPYGGRWFFRLRVRTQVIIVVNLVVGVLIAAGATADYRVVVTSRLSAKAASLDDEAKALLVAIRELRHHGPESVNEYIDSVCAMMSDTHSPGHLIEVELGETYLRSDPSLHAGVLRFRNDETVRGSVEAGDIVVRIAEARSPVVSQSRRSALARVGGIAIAGLFGAAMLNVLLIRLVTRPITELIAIVRAIGHGALGTQSTVTANVEMGELSDAVSAMSRELAERDTERRSQMNRAQRLQRHLIEPSRELSASHIAVEYHPADGVGGDLVDVIEYANGDTLVCVADVVGHGIHAAMAAAILKTMLQSHHRFDTSPAQLMQAINTRFAETSLPEDFASMIIVRLSGSGSSLEYASAGHETCFVHRRNGNLIPLTSTGIVLGVVADAEYDDRRLPLTASDSVVLVSDGVTEAMDDNGTLFGRAALVNLLAAAPDSNETSLGHDVCAAVAVHRSGARQLDDVTVVVARAGAVAKIRGA